MKCLTITALFALQLLQLNAQTTPGPRDVARNAILAAEAAFAAMAAEKGIAEAFWYYADNNATIKRQNDTLITGRDNIRKFYSAPAYSSATVAWAVAFADASSAGDMGYTYGTYVWKSKDKTGKPVEFRGVFHTVWKKNAKGEWKYVWD